MLGLLLFTGWVVFNLIFWFAHDAVPKSKAPYEWFHPSIKRTDDPFEFWKLVVVALVMLLVLLGFIAYNVVKHGFSLP